QRRGQPKPPPEQFTYGDLVIDAAAARVQRGDKVIALRPKELMLLTFLAASPGRVISRTELLEHVWGSTADWQDLSAATQHVRRIRKKLGQRADDCWRIETIRGLGYRFAVASASPSEGDRSE